MSILINKNTRLLVHGITGNEGLFRHSTQMLAYGTNVVAGTTPGKGGEWVIDGKVPVFDSAKVAVEATGANTSCCSSPPGSRLIRFTKPLMPVSLLSSASRKASRSRI